MNKDSLIRGTLILALAAFTARALGVLQRVPLKHLLDDVGMATYGIANNIYLALLIVATAGIPSAISKLIAEKHALGQAQEAARIYRASLYFACAAGAVIAALLFWGAPFYAERISRDPDSALAIRAIAPALLIFPVIAMMRGYFQGQQIMLAGGVSQIVEQILRVLTAVGLALALMLLGYGREWAVAGAAFGSVIGGVGAFAVMLLFVRKLRRSSASAQAAVKGAGAGSVEEQEPQLPSNTKAPAGRMPLRHVYAAIFRLSVPISLISLAVPLIYLIDSSTVIALLQNRIGYDAAKEALGLLTGRAQALAGIPPILAIALSQSIIPIISSAYARGDTLEVSRQASMALKLSLLSGLPVVLVLTAGARPVNGVLFADTLGTGIIALLVASTLFQVLMMTSGAVLMGLGRIKPPMLHVAAGLAVKLAGSLLLAPWLGIYGIITATLLCFAVTMALNLAALRRMMPFKLLDSRRWAGLLLATGTALAAGLAADMGLRALPLPVHPWFAYAGGAVLVAGLVTVLYGWLLYRTRVVTREELEKAPAPVRKLLQRLGRLFPAVGRRASS